MSLGGRSRGSSGWEEERSDDAPLAAEVVVVEVADGLLGVLRAMQPHAEREGRRGRASARRAGEGHSEKTTATHPERLVLEEGKASHDADVDEAADRTKVLLEVGASGLLGDATNVEATTRHCTGTGRQGQPLCTACAVSRLARTH